MLRLTNPQLLRLRPYVVATPDNRDAFDLKPFDLVVEESNLIDPLRMSAAPFLELLKRVDEVTFGPEGMPMPRWVFFDGAELPGGIVGFGAPEDTLDPATKAVLDVPSDYRGLVPLSMFIAIPTFETGVWMAHNLCSMAGRVRQSNLRGLGSLTKAVGLKVFRASAQVGATQWDSPALKIHTRLGPLALLTAWTPAHSEPWTLTYRVELSDARLRHLARDADGRIPEPYIDGWMQSDDHDEMRRLQAEIEQGAAVSVAAGPETVDGGVVRIPLSFTAPPRPS